HVFGPQKGATPEMVATLETRLAAVAAAVEKVASGHANAAGAGAAGGLGFAAIALWRASRRPGAQAVLEAINLAGLAQNVDLVVTGEGCMDEQTLAGKTPMHVAKLARSMGIPVIALAGRARSHGRLVEELGLRELVTLCDASEPDP